MMLGAGGSGDKTYVDDVFSTYVYGGNCADGASTTNTITNEIDLAGEGGLVWCKFRNTLLGSAQHVLVDTVRGVNKYIMSDSTAAEATTNSVSAFNSNGFTLTGQGPGGGTNYGQGGSAIYSSWSFRKATGFFTMCTWTGNGTNGRQIAHDLNSVPGCVIVKCTSQDQAWSVYHRGLNGGVTPEQYHIILNTDNDEDTTSDWNDTAPTSTHFTVGDGTRTNYNGYTYVAYVFAGGESTAATAVSLDFNGGTNAQYLKVQESSSDFTMGTGDFTVECWVKFDNTNNKGIFQISDNSAGLKATVGSGIAFAHTGSAWRVYANNAATSFTAARNINQWYHIAVVRNSSVTKCYVDGNQILSFSDTYDYDGTYIGIGGYYATDLYLVDGQISNFRVVKGTAVYTSAFRPPTEPLTNITNTKLLCCNNSSATGSTVTPGTLTLVGGSAITASTDSPFDDPAAFKFGEEGDQGIIKCGKWTQGSGMFTAYLGWEPQWIIHKRADGAGDWQLKDTMRGWGETGFKRGLRSNTTDAEESSLTDKSTPTATGFTFDPWYSDGEEVIFMCIRMPDGYVGKPAEAGTDVFAMDGTYNGSGVFPQFTSGFPVDMSLSRNPTGSGTWDTWHMGARLLQGKYQLSSSNAAWATGGNFQYDYNDGIFIGGWDGYMSWMWKRHAGFDVVCYEGDGVAGRQIRHSLNKTVEMMWVKMRSDTDSWQVYHKGLNGGSNPEDYNLRLDQNIAEQSSSVLWNGVAPTSTHITLGSDDGVNGSNETYIAMLFSSISGISKCGYYDGTDTTQTITTGFSPRFVILKRVNTTGSWFVLDTTRGWSSGNDKFLLLNSTAAQDGNYNLGEPTATGFTLTGNDSYNNAGDKFIYYAHA